MQLLMPEAWVGPESDFPGGADAAGPAWNSKAQGCCFSLPCPRKFWGFQFGPVGLGGFISEGTRNGGSGDLVGVGCDQNAALAQIRLRTRCYTKTRAQWEGVSSPGLWLIHRTSTWTSRPHRRMVPLLPTPSVTARGRLPSVRTLT